MVLIKKLGLLGDLERYTLARSSMFHPAVKDQIRPEDFWQLLMSCHVPMLIVSAAETVREHVLLMKVLENDQSLLMGKQT